MEKFSYTKLHSDRRKFLKKYEKQDHVMLPGKSNILLSMPHGVSQVRLSKYKVAEIGALATALYLKKSTTAYLIAKTKNNNDDANFDKRSLYKDTIRKLVENNDIQFVVDIHGLAASRNCDINLGTHLGHNIHNHIDVFNALIDRLIRSGFVVAVDQPFMAGSNTIAGCIKDEYPNIWTIQIEINCAITNQESNAMKWETLLDVLTDWIEYINNTN